MSHLLALLAFHTGNPGDHFREAAMHFTEAFNIARGAGLTGNPNTPGFPPAVGLLAAVGFVAFMAMRDKSRGGSGATVKTGGGVLKLGIVAVVAYLVIQSGVLPI